MPRHAVIIEGPPLSGKDTVAARLAAEEGYYHINCGDLLRGEKMPKEIRDAIDKGDLAPDEYVIDVFFKRLPEELPQKVVITGFPRSAQQLKWLKSHLGDDGYVVHVVMINVSEGAIFERLKKRKVEGRPDDNESILNNRIQKYREYGPQVRSVIYAHYRTTREINGETPEEAVWREVRRFVCLESFRFDGSHLTRL